MAVTSPPRVAGVAPDDAALAVDPRDLPYWRGLSKSAKRILLNRFTRSGAFPAHVLDAESLRSRPFTRLADSPRSVTTFGVPTNIRVNNPAEDTGAGNHTTQSETSIGVRPPFVVVTFNDSNPVAGFSGYSNSVDAGMTFNDDIDLSTSSNDSGDGVVAVDRSGTVYAATLRDDGTGVLMIEVVKSTDNGATFGSAVDASAGITSAGDSMDKPWIAVDATGGTHDGTVYLAWTRFLADGTATLVISHSTDGGTTWAAPQTISSANSGAAPHQGAAIAVAPDGTAYVAWLDRAGNQMLVRRSTDGGTTWTNPVVGGGAAATLTQIGTLNGNIDASSFPSAASGPEGNLYVVYAGASGVDAANVYLVRSTDQGQHFSSPVRVNDDTGTTDQWMPSVAVAGNGVVAVMFYDRRNDPTNALIDVYAAMSIDQGASFLPNKRITETNFPPAVNFESDRVRWDYMGDYNQMVAVGTRFYMAWGDNRDSVGSRHDPNVYYASIGTEDCFVRDNPSDDGYAPSAPGQAWQSPDISPDMNPSIFGTPNPVHIEVHNFGPKAASDVTCRLYWADPATYIPRAAWRPDRIQVETSAGTFTDTNEQLIASVAPAGSTEPPQPFIWNPAPPEWATDVGHFCLLAEIESAGDPLTYPGAGGWQTIERDNNLAVHNIHVQPAGHAPIQIRFLIGADLDHDILTELVLDTRYVPPEYKPELRIDPAIAKHAQLSAGAKLETVPHTQRDKEDRDRREDATEQGRKFTPTPAGRIRLPARKIVRLSELKLSAGKNSLAAINLGAFHDDQRGGQLRITQRIEGQVVGGLLYLLQFHGRRNGHRP